MYAFINYLKDVDSVHIEYLLKDNLWDKDYGGFQHIEFVEEVEEIMLELKELF